MIALVYANILHPPKNPKYETSDFKNLDKGFKLLLAKETISVMYCCLIVVPREPKLEEKKGNRFHNMVPSDLGLESTHRKCRPELKLQSLYLVM